MKITYLKNASKWIWILLVIGFIAYYAWPKRITLIEVGSNLGWGPLLIAMLLIFLAKLGLVENMYIACLKFKIDLKRPDCFQIYNHTQLAKYVPGSIWQFVGRISILKNKGFLITHIKNAILAEHLWVILVAAIFSIYPLLQNWSEFVKLINIPNLFINFNLINNIILISLLFCFILLFFVIQNKLIIFFYWLIKLTPSLKAVVILSISWLLFGTSLWITLIPFATENPPYFYIVGIYSLAYIIGFFVPFAPAGLGIREAILVFYLAKYVETDVALLLSVANRLVYFIAELILAILAFKTNLIYKSERLR